MSSPYAPLPGLLTASWRGVEFHVPDLTTPAGRRVHQVTFPGSDIPAYQDLGLHLGPVRVAGLLGGDDWLAKGRALKAAFDQPGPGTLVHPWLGPMLMVLAEPVEITTRDSHLRVVFFEASFHPFQPGSGSLGAPTLGPMLAFASSLASLASSWLQAAFTPRGFETLAARVTAAATAGPGGAVLAARRLLPAVPAAPDAASAAAWTIAYLRAIGWAGAPPASPAIGPGPSGRPDDPVVAPRVAVRALLNLSDALAAGPLAGDVADRLRASARAAALAAAITPLAAIPYESRQEARRWRAVVASAVDAARVALADAGAVAPDQARALWTGLTDLKRATLADIDERIGRLPSVLTVEVPGEVSAWLIAQHVQGDAPDKLVACYDDMVARNKLRHPAIAGPGPVETLPVETLPVETWPR